MTGGPPPPPPRRHKGFGLFPPIIFGCRGGGAHPFFIFFWALAAKVAAKTWLRKDPFPFPFRRLTKTDWAYYFLLPPRCLFSPFSDDREKYDHPILAGGTAFFDYSLLKTGLGCQPFTEPIPFSTQSGRRLIVSRCTL